MASILKKVHKAWVQSVTAFPFLNFAGPPHQVVQINPGQVKYQLQSGTRRWLIFLHKVLGGRGGIIWYGNWDQKKIPLDNKGLEKYSQSSRVEQKKQGFKREKGEIITILMDREGNLILLEDKKCWGERNEKIPALIAFYHGIWVEKNEAH